MQIPEVTFLTSSPRHRQRHTAALVLLTVPTVASVINLSKIYRKPGTTVEVAALRAASIDFEEGGFTAIMGSSGSGNSTLMNILGCLDRPPTGSYVLGDTDVSQLPDDELSEIRS